MNYHNDIDRLPLSIFIDCLVDANYRSLIKEGEVEDSELIGAWLDIKEAYVERMGNSEQRLLIKLVKEVNIIMATLNGINLLLDILPRYYCKELGDELNRLLGTNFQFNARNREEFDKLITRCNNRKAGIELQKEVKEAALKEMEEKLQKQGGEKPSRSYFNQMLNLMEEHFKVGCDTNMTTGRYCDRVTRMVEQLRKQQDHGKRKKR